EEYELKSSTILSQKSAQNSSEKPQMPTRYLAGFHDQQLLDVRCVKGTLKMATYKSDKRYDGDENIVIGFDIGTTQSAVSFSYVYPGEYPEVIKWPGQPESSGDSKNGKAQAFGAEAREYMDDESYEIASWFKSMKTSDLPPSYGNPHENSRIEIPDLPRNTTLKQIYSDMIQYLYTKTKKFFAESLPSGQNIWNRLETSIVLVFCMPNGWDIAQQSLFRQAVIDARLVRAEEADDRIEFITEGEASVHYALAHTRSSMWLERGIHFTVVDAGGSTIDSTLYECKSVQPLQLEEAGGVFVDRAARRMLENKLGNSQFNEDEYLKEMVSEFEKKTKRLFDGTQSSNVVQFGRARDNDRSHGILKGKINLTTAEVRSTFDDTVARTVSSCGKLLSTCGFGESPFLRKRLTESFERVEIVTVDEPSF
ncbi:7679_t:CDS:2, partial [Acaulospora colombiana]